jgi:hypothetical protein
VDEKELQEKMIAEIRENRKKMTPFQKMVWNGLMRKLAKAAGAESELAALMRRLEDDDG